MSAGKGDRRRVAMVSQEKYSENWNKIFKSNKKTKNNKSLKSSLRTGH